MPAESEKQPPMTVEHQFKRIFGSHIYTNVNVMTKTTSKQKNIFFYRCPLKIKNEFSIAVTLCKSERTISTDKSKSPEFQTPDAFEKTFSVQEKGWI